MMMRGMTAKNFDPIRYSGRWFEVASLKRGFAGQGQEDCHCTQAVSIIAWPLRVESRTALYNLSGQPLCRQPFLISTITLGEPSGVYTFDREKPAIQVDTFCVHGSPNGYITGIRGRVQCLSLEDMEKSETPLEMQEMIREKCFLRFPTLPFIPKLPYDVIATDYDNFALVS
ncbi:apolipoprotein d, partial [Trifolium pratense]